MSTDAFEFEQFREFEDPSPGHRQACCNACRGRSTPSEGEILEITSEVFEDETKHKAAPAPIVSPLATISKFGLRDKNRRKQPVYGVVVHTTGGGPARKARINQNRHPKRCTKAFDCAVEVYESNEGYPNYVIDYDGTIVCTCSEGYVASHAGRNGAAARYLKENGAPAWWKAVWGAKASPFAVAPHPNGQYIGVELLQSERGGSYTEQQYQALARLIADIGSRHGIRWDRPPNRALLGHEDVNPAPYTTKLNAEGKAVVDINGRSLRNLSAGWDPGFSRGWFSWDKLWGYLVAFGQGAPAKPAGATSPEAPSFELELVPEPFSRFAPSGTGVLQPPGTKPAACLAPTAKGLKPSGKKLGGAKGYSQQRLDTTLLDLRAAGKLTVTDEQIDLFQRISNVETGGAITALNTWDSAVVSIGFMQWTLHYGKLQEWIQAAAPAFGRYGIAVDPSATYRFGRHSVPAIQGARTKGELRCSPWAERFWKAGFDPEIIAVEVQLAIQHIARQLATVRAWCGKDAHRAFVTHYRANAWLRAVFHEGYNNRPVAAKAATCAALARAARGSSNDFFEVFKAEMLRAFAAIGDAGKGRNVVNKTRVP